MGLSYLASRPVEIFCMRTARGRGSRDQRPAPVVMGRDACDPLVGMAEISLIWKSQLCGNLLYRARRAFQPKVCLLHDPLLDQGLRRALQGAGADGVQPVVA